MITSAAVKLKNGRVFVGRTHGECLVMVKALVCHGAHEEFKLACEGHSQGFVNDRLEFKTRTEAWEEALAFGQVSGNPRELTSEDLLSVYNH